MSRKSIATVLAVACAASFSLSGCGNARGSHSADQPNRPVATSREREPESPAPGSDSSEGSYLTTPGAQPTVAPQPGETTGSAIIPIDPSARPTMGPAATPWSAPDVKFYVEDFSVWYYDQSVVNEGSVSDKGNIEGYRTYNGQCKGYVHRDISVQTHASVLSDTLLSSAMVERNDQTISDVKNQPEQAASVVRDAGGTMEGYWLYYSGTFNYDDGTTKPVEGYKFARAVKDAGLRFSVQVMCDQGANITEEEWLTTLKGIRLEGVTAGSMN